MAAVSGNTYSWSPSTGLNASNIAQPLASPTTTTTYTITVTNSCGCSATSAVTVYFDNIPPATPTGTGASRCGTGSVTLTATSASGTTIYWKDISSNAVLATGPSFTTPSLSSTTNYSIWAFNATNGCWSNSAIVTATINPFPNANAGTGGTITCTSNTSGIAIGTSSTSGYTYSWSPNGIE